MNVQRTDNAIQPEIPERRDDHRRAYTSGWIGGAVLVVLGMLLLLQNLTDLHLDNWWALFILIPAAHAFGRAWSSYQVSGGHLTARARSSLFGGLILTLIAAIFLFELSWTIVGPVVIILLGVSLLTTSLFPR